MLKSWERRREDASFTTAFVTVLAVSTGVVVTAAAIAAALSVLLVTASMRGRQKRGAKRRDAARRDLDEARERAGSAERDRETPTSRPRGEPIQTREPLPFEAQPENDRRKRSQGEREGSHPTATEPQNRGRLEPLPRCSTLVEIQAHQPSFDPSLRDRAWRSDAQRNRRNQLKSAWRGRPANS